MQRVIAISQQENKWETVKGLLQKLGAAMMFPITLVAFASLFLGLSFVLPSELLITDIINKLSSIIFIFFPILVFLSIIMHFHNNINETTIINSASVLLIFIATLYISDHLELVTVFSMIMLASLLIIVDRRIYNIYLYYLICFSLSLLLILPIIITNYLIYLLGYLISLLPWGLSAFVYGFTNRMLIPFGLHSVLMPTFLFTEAGGLLTIYNDAGEIVNTVGGDSQIWVYMYTNGLDFTQLTGSFINDGMNYTYEVTNSYNVGQYQQGFLPMLTFAFPMLGITYIIMNGWEEGKKFLLITLMTAMTGVTEMTEFSFIFISPTLYIVNALLFGASFFLMNVLDCSVWISTGWSIDIIMFGIIPSLKGYATHWYWIPAIGIGLGIIYSIIFSKVYNKIA